MRLFGLEFSLETASLDALETLAKSMNRASVRARFARSEGTEEVALLVTCHRVELALLVRSVQELDRWRDALPGAQSGWRLREGRAAIAHLFRVASGLESLAPGEGEVRHQVRVAGRQVDSRHPRPILREIFLRAAKAAEELAPEVPLSQSIAAVAAAHVRELTRTPLPRVLVIGSGTVGRQVAVCLAAEARVTMLFHEKPPSDAFLRSTGARAKPLDQLAEELAGADAVVTAAKFGDRGLRAADLPSNHRLVLIDLGMPRNIDPEVRALPGVHLVDLETLYADPHRRAGRDGAEEPLMELADRCADRVEQLLWEPWIASLRRAAEDLRRNELAIAAPFLGELEPEQAVAVDRLTQRLVARILLAPTQRLRSLPPGPEGERLRKQALDLLHPRPDDQ